MQPLEKFGERLSELMFYKGNMTSQKLADAIKVNASTIRRWKSVNKIMKKININRETLVRNLEKSHGHFYFWEKGVDPTMTIVCELADYLHCSLDELAGRER